MMMLGVSCADYDKCPLFWTSGQRAKTNHATLPAIPYVWKLRPAVWQTMYQYTNWPMSGPSPSGDCVHVAVGEGQQGWKAGVWGTSPCETRLCVVCECPIINQDDYNDDDDDEVKSAD